MMDISRLKKTKRKSWLVITMVVSFCLFSSNASFVYATNSDNINLGISATISAKCKFMGAGQSISFGQYDAILENEMIAANSSTNVATKCTRNTTSEITMGTGMHAEHAVAATRAMSDGMGNYLSYEIYSDASRADVWNDTEAVSYTDQGGTSTPVPIYASIPPDQDAVPGEYYDTVVMTVSY